MVNFLRLFGFGLLFCVALIPFLLWSMLPKDQVVDYRIVFVLFFHLCLCAVLYFVLRQAEERTKIARSQVSYATSEQFSALYERSPIPYLTLNERLEVLMYNQAAVKILETTTSKIEGLNLTERLSLGDDTATSILLGKISSGLTIDEQEVQLRTDTGQIKWVLLSVFATETTGQCLVSLIDITRQKAIDAAKSDFVALATHQLRTPITAIRWNVELLERHLQANITPEQTSYLEKINRNVLRMLALINDFLSVSKLEMGTFATSLETVNLSEFSDAIVEEFEQRVIENKIVFNRSDNPPNLTFKTDPRLLHIIISNLISNAVKYVPTGGVVSYSYTEENDSLIFVVSDTGIGIPEDEQGQLFSKFFRARNAYAHKSGGTGLGLYIVKQSVEKLGGTIALSSKEKRIRVQSLR